MSAVLFCKINCANAQRALANAKFKIQNAKFKPPSEEAPEGRALEEVDAEGRRRERPFKNKRYAKANAK